MTEYKYYPAEPAPMPTALLTRYAPGTTSVTVQSVDYIPEAPNRITLYDNSGVVTTLGYTGISGTTLTGLSFVEGDNLRAYEVGESFALRTINADDINTLQQGKIDKYQGVAEAGKILRVGNDGEVHTSDAATSYNDLEDKPSINNVTIVGDKQAIDYNLATNTDLQTHTNNTVIHVTAEDKAIWTGKQNKVYYQTDTPVGAVPGDLWCTDGVEEVTFANITGQPSDNTALATVLNDKVGFVTGTQKFKLGLDSHGLYYEVIADGHRVYLNGR